MATDAETLKKYTEEALRGETTIVLDCFPLGEWEKLQDNYR